MPVKFLCQHCRHRLKVTRRKIGTSIECPVCGGNMVVPSADAARAALAMASVGVNPPPTAETAQFAVFDDAEDAVDDAAGNGVPLAAPRTPSRSEVATSAGPQRAGTLTYGMTDSVRRAESAGKSPLVSRQPAASMLLVSRRVLYLQAVLFAGLAVLMFSAGFVIGVGSSGGRPAAGVGPQPDTPVLVRGKITYAGGKTPGDEGAVIVVLPREKQGRLDGKQFHPQGSGPADGSPALMALEELGGQFARATDTGDFSLAVPKAGEYYVLVISRQTLQAGGSDIRPEDRRQMEQFFVSAAELIGRQKYVWSLERIDGGLWSKSHDFGASGT